MWFESSCLPTTWVPGLRESWSLHRSHNPKSCQSACFFGGCPCIAFSTFDFNWYVRKWNLSVALVRSCLCFLFCPSFSSFFFHGFFRSLGYQTRLVWDLGCILTTIPLRLMAHDSLFGVFLSLPSLPLPPSPTLPHWLSYRLCILACIYLYSTSIYVCISSPLLILRERMPRFIDRWQFCNMDHQWSQLPKCSPISEKIIWVVYTS